MLHVIYFPASNCITLFRSLHKGWAQLCARAQRNGGRWRWIPTFFQPHVPLSRFRLLSCSTNSRKSGMKSLSDFRDPQAFGELAREMEEEQKKHKIQVTKFARNIPTAPSYLQRSELSAYQRKRSLTHSWYWSQEIQESAEFIEADIMYAKYMERITAGEMIKNVSYNLSFALYILSWPQQACMRIFTHVT